MLRFKAVAVPEDIDDEVSDDDQDWQEALDEADADDPAVIRTEEEKNPKEEIEEIPEDNTPIESKTEKKTEETSEDDDDEEVVEADPNANPNYVGKTNKELIAMIENGNRKISEQGSEIRLVKDMIEDLKETKTEDQYTQFKEELLKKYEPEDIELIEKMVDMKTGGNKKEERSTKTPSNNRQNELDNERAWQMLNIGANQELATEFDPIMRQEIAADPQNTLFKKNWVANRFHELSKNRKAPEAPKDPVEETGLTSAEKKAKIVKRKVSASTVKSGGGSPAQMATQSKWKDQPEPDDPDEYAEWYEVNTGKKI